MQDGEATVQEQKREKSFFEVNICSSSLTLNIWFTKYLEAEKTKKMFNPGYTSRNYLKLRGCQRDTCTWTIRVCFNYSDLEALAKGLGYGDSLFEQCVMYVKALGENKALRKCVKICLQAALTVL